MKDEGDCAPDTTPEQQRRKPTSRTSDACIYKCFSHTFNHTCEIVDSPENDEIPAHSVPKPRADNLTNFTPRILPTTDATAVLRNYFILDVDYVPSVIPSPKQQLAPEPKVRLNKSYDQFPYPDFGEGIYTKSEWGEMNLSAQCAVYNFWNELKLKDEEAKKRRQKSKEKSHKKQKSLWLNKKEYTNFDDVPTPPVEEYQSYYGELKRIGHLPECQIIPTVKLLYLYDDFMSSIKAFNTMHNVKNIDDPIDAVGVDVHMPCPSRYRDELDEKYTRQIDTFKAICEERNRHVCLITITTSQKNKFICDQAALLREVDIIIKKELKKQFKGISIIDVLSYHSTGYSHTHLIVDYALSPEMQKYMTDVYVNSHEGASRNGINFINYKNPNSPLSLPIPEDSTPDRCFGYLKKNAVTSPTTEKEAFAKTLFNACHWFISKSSDYTGMNRINMSGPIGAEVEKRMKKKVKPSGRIYERISITKSSGNTVDVIDIAFDEIPKRKKQKVAEYLSERPRILKQYLNKGITDIYQIVELHWKAHYLESIEKRKADKAVMIELKKKINALSLLEYQFYLIHYKTHVVDKEELLAMQIAYDRTIDPKWNYAHQRWLPLILERNPGIKPPVNYHPFTGEPIGPSIPVAHPIT